VARDHGHSFAIMGCAITQLRSECCVSLRLVIKWHRQKKEFSPKGEAFVGRWPPATGGRGDPRWHTLPQSLPLLRRRVDGAVIFDTPYTRRTFGGGACGMAWTRSGTPKRRRMARTLRSKSPEANRCISPVRVDPEEPFFILHLVGGERCKIRSRRYGMNPAGCVRYSVAHCVLVAAAMAAPRYEIVTDRI